MLYRQIAPWLVLLPVLLLCISGCTGDQSSSNQLTGSNWLLESYGNPDNLNGVLAGTIVSLNFENDARTAGGSAGCNTYGGKFDANGGSIHFSELFHTEMYCIDPPGVMQQESDYIDLLFKAQTFDLQSELLVIHCQGGQVLRFIPSSSDD